ncbi:hypothetical protein DV515_00017420 [Chloebia gouldiae]|uniref:Uncharacterized protein n=1 Tax=Chloebia gouldiae TaxID=44316 RepID=A0A3L8QVP6_CHLGU|nr:hypothetical protein DV515_00017420 [Chloebia gouldiae]
MLCGIGARDLPETPGAAQAPLRRDLGGNSGGFGAAPLSPCAIKPRCALSRLRSLLDGGLEGVEQGRDRDQDWDGNCDQDRDRDWDGDCDRDRDQSRDRDWDQDWDCNRDRDQDRDRSRDRDRDRSRDRNRDGDCSRDRDRHRDRDWD